MLNVADQALVAFVGIYLVAAPYTKVEESFNLQAIHDFLYNGRDLAKYDHVEFPGVVPRTAIGAFVVSIIARPFQWFGVPKPEMQLVVRAVLGLLNAFALIGFRRAIVSLYGPKRGKQTGNWFMLLLLGQFHMLFYASRTLPNMLALPLVLLSYSKFLGSQYTSSLVWLAFTAVVFRSELCILWACMALSLLAVKRQSLTRLFVAGLVGATLGTVATVTVDSAFWQKFPSFPELQGIIYNVVEGKSANWGVEPWEAYFTTHLPNLLANPLIMVLALFALHVTPRNLQMLFTAGLAFVCIYSFQPHKELRFVIYVAPLWTALAARGIDYLSFAQGRKSVVVRLGWWLCLGASLLMVGVALLKLDISSRNYPGGHALSFINELVDDMSVVHFDVASCMTGVSRFGQSRDLVYDKTEEDIAYSALDYYVGTEMPPVFNWEQVEAIPTFKHLSRHAAVAAIKGARKLPWNWETVKRIWASVVVCEPYIYIYKRVLDN